jgi:hypothetical protein
MIASGPMQPVFDTHFHIIDPASQTAFFDNAVVFYRPREIPKA